MGIHHIYCRATASGIDNLLSITDAMTWLCGNEDLIHVDRTTSYHGSEINLVTAKLSKNKDIKSKHGLYRSLINNIIIGISKGFEKELELFGVGYRASNQGQKLDLSLGYSHNIIFSYIVFVFIKCLDKIFCF